MSQYLKINLEGLLTHQVLNLVPSESGVLNNKSTRSEELLSTLRKWTSKAIQNEPYSGYRRQILSREGLPESQALATVLRERFSSMLVFGIGGSALGTRSMLEALAHRIPKNEKRNLRINDNLDPLQFEEDWQASPPESTCYVIVSKSGSTLESISQLSLCLERLELLKLPIQDHVIVVTDQETGPLRQWAEENAIKSLSIPSDVGGRFSVFSPVGLLPLAFAGLKVEALVDGACEFFSSEEDLKKTSELALRLVAFEQNTFWAHVLMPYATKLKCFSSWFVQLWAESLGKRKSYIESTGQIPVSAIGATDQHSILQFLAEGPNKIVTAFVKIEEWTKTTSKPAAVSKFPAQFATLSFASSKTFSEILNAELKATQKTLEALGRPYYELCLPTLCEESLGALHAFYMDLVSLAGAALEIDPYNQPGVEQTKKLIPEFI